MLGEENFTDALLVLISAVFPLLYVACKIPPSLTNVSLTIYSTLVGAFFNVNEINWLGESITFTTKVALLSI